jgi:hypothetical protein
MKGTTNKKWPVVVLGVWIAIVVGLSTLPLGSSNLSGFWPGVRWDYGVHAILYSVLAFLIAWNMVVKYSFAKLRIVYITIFISAVFGFLMEIIQLYVSVLGRSFEWNDALFNFAGAAMGAFLFLFIFKNK